MQLALSTSYLARDCPVDESVSLWLRLGPATAPNRATGRPTHFHTLERVVACVRVLGSLLYSFRAWLAHALELVIACIRVLQSVLYSLVSWHSFLGCALRTAHLTAHRTCIEKAGLPPRYLFLFSFVFSGRLLEVDSAPATHAAARINWLTARCLSARFSNHWRTGDRRASALGDPGGGLFIGFFSAKCGCQTILRYAPATGTAARPCIF